MLNLNLNLKNLFNHVPAPIVEPVEDVYSEVYRRFTEDTAAELIFNGWNYTRQLKYAARSGSGYSAELQQLEADLCEVYDMLITGGEQHEDLFFALLQNWLDLHSDEFIVETADALVKVWQCGIDQTDDREQFNQWLMDCGTPLYVSELLAASVELIN
jgi:hypothetical protein